MSDRSKKKVHDHTHMADLSAQKCMEAHLEGRYFTLKHPARSLAQHSLSWKRLLSLEGVNIIYYNTCMFSGRHRKKNQMLICNQSGFNSLGMVSQGRSICDRTGIKHLKWRRTTSGGRLNSSRRGTKGSTPRVSICQAYAQCARAREILGSRGRFVEVFSGANAPLSRAVCEVLGESLKGSKVRTDKGLKVELQRLAQVLGEGPQVVAGSPYGRRATESRDFGKQDRQTAELREKAAAHPRWPQLS